ncbi:MAG: M20/M25/M40 family metallo-hydrolase [Thermodesulfobacteriota bacterium]
MVTDREKAVLDGLDPDYIVKFAMNLTDIFSPTGAERPATEFVYRELLSLGLKARLQELSDTRANALGELRGSGGGYTLMFNGHMDISYTGQETYVPGGDYSMLKESAGTTGFSLKPSYIDQGWICGNGIRNMKAAMAAYLGAVKALIASKVPLKGDLLIAAVAGEIEKSQVDDYRGAAYDGYGAGTRYLTTHGGVADMGIIGEPSYLEICRGNMGTIWVKIGLRGDMTHTAWCDRLPNPILQTIGLFPVLQDWIEKYRASHVFMDIKPPVNVSAIQGGWPWRLARSPGYCDLYLDLRIVPGQSPLEVKEEVGDLIKAFQAQDPKLNIDFEILVTDPPTIIAEDEPVVQAVKAAHEKVLGRPPGEHFDVPVSDANHLNRYGIPTLTYGPSGKNREGRQDYGYGWQKIEDLINCAKVYALTALDVCSREKTRPKV